MWGHLYEWLKVRVPLEPLREVLAKKTVPVHRFTLCYYLGGMTLFFFLVQVVTGILLMLYYRPSADEAFESVEFIMTTVPFGWLMRSLHAWSANLMIFFLFLHLVTVFFMKGYRAPRELTWMSGVVLLGLALAFGFSGYLLPWNKLAFFATAVGTDIAGSVPLVGEYLMRFLRGGDRITGGTLSRFYGWHVAILPAVTTLVLGFHLLLVQIHGMSVPPGEEERARRHRPLPFFPNFLLRDLFGWTLALAILATLAALVPWELGEKADPFAPAYKDIRPEWYFMFMFEALKLFPGGEFWGIEFEAIPILLFGLLGVVLFSVPLLEKTPTHSRFLVWAGALVLAYVIVLTAWGYRSWFPVVLVIAAALPLLLHAQRMRDKGERGE